MRKVSHSAVRVTSLAYGERLQDPRAAGAWARVRDLAPPELVHLPGHQRSCAGASEPQVERTHEDGVHLRQAVPRGRRPQQHALALDIRRSCPVPHEREQQKCHLSSGSKGMSS